MCMARIGGKFPISAEEGKLYGYKVFRIHRGKLRGEFCGRNRVRPTGVWLNADDFASKQGWFPAAAFRFPAQTQALEPGHLRFQTYQFC